MDLDAWINVDFFSTESEEESDLDIHLADTEKVSELGNIDRMTDSPTDSPLLSSIQDLVPNTSVNEIDSEIDNKSGLLPESDTKNESTTDLKPPPGQEESVSMEGARLLFFRGNVPHADENCKWQWRKYGSKFNVELKMHCCYFRCMADKCKARKHVFHRSPRLDQNSIVSKIMYVKQHCHEPPASLPRRGRRKKIRTNTRPPTSEEPIPTTPEISDLSGKTGPVNSNSIDYPFPYMNVVSDLPPGPSTQEITLEDMNVTDEDIYEFYSNSPEFSL